MTRCANRQSKQALRALLRGGLKPEAFQRLRAHAAECADCREAYERVSRVERALEKRALPERHQRLLERELFTRLEASTPPAKAPARGWPAFPSFFLPALTGLALAGLSLLVWGPTLRARAPEAEWQSRGGSGLSTTAWGVRAFCVGKNGLLRGEARPGGTLSCGEGNAVQFSYTAPAAAHLAVEATSPEGEPLRFFPPEGDAARVEAGVDVPLPYSTPVQRDWLKGLLEVRSRFTDANGRELSLTRLTLSPE